MNKQIRKVVLPVGGLGTRFLPATKAVPKEMLPVVDKPIIQYAVEEARAAGIEEIVFVTGRGKSVIEDHFDHSYELEATLEARRKHAVLAELESILPKEGNIAYTRQQLPLGLGHAVWCARGLIGNEPFAVILADDLVQSDTPCLAQMIEAYNDTGGNLVAVTEVEKDATDRYGIIDPGEEKGRLVEVKGMVEKPSPDQAPSRLAIIGRYILQPQVFDYLSERRKGAGGEIQLTDALASLIGSQPFHGYRFEGTRYDCGDKIGYLQANIAYALDRPDLAGPMKAYIKNIQTADG